MISLFVSIWYITLLKDKLVLFTGFFIKKHITEEDNLAIRRISGITVPQKTCWNVAMKVWHANNRKREVVLFIIQHSWYFTITYGDIQIKKSSVRSRRFYLQYQFLRVNFLVWLLKFFSITKCTKIITKSKGSMKLFDSCVSSLINLSIKSYLFFARYKLALVRFYRNHNKLS